MVGSVAAMVSFAESSALLAELAGVPVNPKQVERTAEALGCEIAADERQVLESSPPAAPTMYLGMDGTGVPLRPSELVDRKQWKRGQIYFLLFFLLRIEAFNWQGAKTAHISRPGREIGDYLSHPHGRVILDVIQCARPEIAAWKPSLLNYEYGGRDR